MSSSGGTNVNAGTGFLWGQSFTATCNGQLDSVEFIANANGTVSAGTLNLYNGSSVTGSIYAQPFPAFPVTMGGPMRIVLTTPLPVTLGSQYTFEFFVDVNILANFSNVYPGGEPFQNGSAVPTADIDFNAYVSPPASIYEPVLASVQLYPNPATGVFNISLGDNTPHARVELYNVTGMLVMARDLNEKITALDARELPPGMYIAKVKSEEKAAMFKVIVQ